ncbi:hypothetical protein CC78DRAFT_547297 [Lojkania enalia]|uniref:Uncharacterized protein n=1 Tax=Lojkania enalia TaxID=147567 RepID=A0A9P4K5T8_9PLEO|nr:hypothetical protein CC78DRAFT_547297 [Didymosphaeria enalia]
MKINEKTRYTCQKSALSTSGEGGGVEEEKEGAGEKELLKCQQKENALTEHVTPGLPNCGSSLRLLPPWKPVAKFMLLKTASNNSWILYSTSPGISLARLLASDKGTNGKTTKEKPSIAEAAMIEATQSRNSTYSIETLNAPLQAARRGNNQEVVSKLDFSSRNQ